jgi:hypothetical protein
LKIRGQARRRIKERLVPVLYLAHRKSADCAEGGGYTPGRYRLLIDQYVPPGSWYAMADAAIDFFFEIKMDKHMEALVGDRMACARDYRAAREIVSPRSSRAPAAKAVGQNGAGSESLRETGYGTASRVRELFRALLAEIDNIERKHDRT